MKYTLYSFLIAVTLFSSCSTTYVLTKSNRDEYSINDKVGVDSSIIKTYLPYKTALDSEMNQVIGYTDVALVKRSSLPESILGNFFSDAVFNQAKKLQQNIDFAFPSTNGGLRNDVAKGPITVSNIFELMPFENETVLFNLKGKDVLEILKFIAASGGQPVSGLKMNIKNSLPENIFINGKEFNENKDYMVLTSDYIASGGDDSKGFANPISKKVLGLKIRDALLNEVKDIQSAGKKINVKLDGRITKN
ncbi:5'-nucleotidase [Pedobacter sp. Du54]|uniref:5'-nucleotidase n=1 Tax=Pedobacter anseongensis TaxID=3133439 RepID=UPI0030AF20F3